MPWMYCPSESLDTSTGQCSDPHWVQDSPGGLPPLTGEQGAQIAASIVGAWALGYVGRLIVKAMKGRI